MATDDDSYRRLLAEYRKRDNFESVFRTALDDLAAEVDLSWVRSCVAFGCGSGEHEIEFVRRLLPNLSKFIAIDPDHESIEALRSNFESAQLAGVETAFMETSAENWNGADKPVDVALFFNVLYHVEGDARQQLFQKLGTQHLNPDGIIVIIDSESPDTSGIIRLMRSLGYAQNSRYGDIEEEVLACGFCSVDSVRDIVGTRDLSNPTEGILKYLKLHLGNAIGDELIRAAIAEIYADPDPKVKHVVRKMGIFRKSSPK